MSGPVRVTVDEHGVAEIRLDRPPVNAIDADVYRGVADAARQVSADDAVGAVVLTGGPKVFAAGADIKAMKGYTPADSARFARELQEAFELVARIPKVVIAAVAGYALGGGCELAMCADFRFAADSAKLGQPEILLGIIPGAGGTQRLPRLVGTQRAKELIYGGGMLRAEEAREIGLVDQVHPADDLHDRAHEAARRYAAGPWALRQAKRAIDDGYDLDLAAALRLETALFTATFGTDDQRTGMESFVEHGPGRATFTRT